MSYTELTREQRYQIYALRKAEHTRVEPAAIVGVHKSTISREVRRNRGRRVGDREADAVVGRRGRGALLSLVERKSRLVRLGWVERKRAEEVAEASLGALAPLCAKVLTVTSDNEGLLHFKLESKKLYNIIALSVMQASPIWPLGSVRSPSYRRGP